MKSYKTYDPVDFAQETSFINWVLGKSKKDSIFWRAWLEQHPERAEDIAVAKQLVKSFQFQHEGISASSKAALWDKIDEATSAPVIRLTGARKWLAYAASIAILSAIGLWFFMQNPNQEVRTAKAEFKEVDLHDGTVAELNAI